MDYVPFGAGAPTDINTPSGPRSLEDLNPIGALLAEKKRRQDEEGKKIAAAQQVQAENNARAELARLRSGAAETPRPTVAAATAAGQKAELTGSDSLAQIPSKNVEDGNSDGHGPGIAATYLAPLASDKSYNADLLANSGSDRNFTQRLSGPDHVDLQSLTQGSMAQDDLLQAEMIKRGQAQQTLQGQAEHRAGTDLASMQEEATRAKTALETQDPYYPEHLKSETALGVANAEGMSKIQAARQPKLVERETEQMRMQQFAQAKDQAFRELQKNPKFVMAWNSKDPMVKKQAEDLLDRATQQITEPMKQGMTRYTDRSTGFSID